MSRVMGSLGFAAVYSIYVLAVLGPVQWLIIKPLRAFFPKGRREIANSWLKMQARWVLGLARVIGGMRLRVDGRLPEECCVVLMNHQSLFDIPVAFALVRGPFPHVPTRASYRHGIPGISGLISLVEGPFLEQGDRATRAERDALVAAGDATARGERSFLIYPEGHRSRTGEILPFMTGGLRLVLRRTSNRPLYLIVADGLWGLARFSDIATGMGDRIVRVSVQGPFTIPPDDREHVAFIGAMRSEMIAMLERLRVPTTEAVPVGARPELAR